MTQLVSIQEIRAAGGLEKWTTRASKLPVTQTVAKNATLARPVVPATVPSAKARPPVDRILGYDAERMNGLESRYAGRLEGMRRVGSLAWWEFESITLRLADNTRYTPDFFIVLPDGTAGFHETKGFWRDDGRAKIKVAAELYPMFFFVAVQWDAKSKGWKYENFRKQGEK